jgi:hypothetical protein
VTAEKMIEIALANAPLVLMLGSAYAWLTPKIIKSTLMNGGGEIVKNIVRAANAEQTKEHAESLTLVRERLAVVETSLKDLKERK